MGRFFDYLWLHSFSIAAILSAIVFTYYLIQLILDLTRPLDVSDRARNEECYWICSDADLNKINRVVLHGYIVTFLALLLSTLPPIVLSSHPDLKAWSRGSAIGVVMGCQNDSPGLVTSCSAHGDRGQWLLNIGGRVVPTTPAGSTTEGTATAAEEVVAVQGGIVVPLYLVVISILGAAVGIARRLPEYQRRGSRVFADLYLSRQKEGKLEEGEPEPMDAARVREVVVFQIMQVFTAPLVAITAYSLIGTQSASSVVLIAFASGFSTEAVLLLIRNAVEKIGKIGAPPRKPPAVPTAPGAGARNGKPGAGA